MSKRYKLMSEATAKMASDNAMAGKSRGIRKPGKTKRDHASGAWARRLSNRAAKTAADNNARFGRAGKAKKGG